MSWESGFNRYSLWPHELQPSRLLCPWDFPWPEYWSGLSFPSLGDLPKVKWSESHSVMSDSLWPYGLYIVHGILQARILEWVAFLFSRRSSQPRDQTQVSCIAGGFFTNWATREDGIFPTWDQTLVSYTASWFLTIWPARESPDTHYYMCKIDKPQGSTV